jgi:hypothetical protein
MEVVAGRTSPGKHCINFCTDWTPRQGRLAGITKKKQVFLSALPSKAGPK